MSMKITAIASFPQTLTMDYRDSCGEWHEALSVGMALTEDGSLIVLYHDGHDFMIDGEYGPQYIDETYDPTAIPV